MVNMVIDPIAIYIGNYPIHWYGVIIATGLILGVLLTFYECNRIKFDFDIFLDFLIFAIPIAIIGARIYYVAFHWERYSGNPFEIIAIWHGGLAIHGAIIGGALTAIIVAKYKKMSVYKVIDIAAPSLLLGQAIGRWGNFINQEAHGGPVTLNFLQDIHVPQFIIDNMYINGMYYHPTFLYESIWNVLGVIILIIIRTKNPLKGMVFSLYLIWYSIGRFFIEGLRTDSLAIDGPDWLISLFDFLWSPMKLIFEPGAMAYGNVRTAQLTSLGLIIIGLAYIIYRKKINNDGERYVD